MTRNFSLVKKAGLLDDIINIEEYEKRVSIGQAEARVHLRIISHQTRKNCFPTKEEILSLYKIIFQNVYQGAGKKFREPKDGIFPLDDCGYERDKEKWIYAARARIINFELDKLYREASFLMRKIEAEQNPKAKKIKKLEVISFWHYRFLRIHPFKDGNGRIARLFSNYQIHHLIHKHTNILFRGDSETKDNYIWALRKSGRRKSLTPLMEFLATQFNQSANVAEFVKEEIGSFKSCDYPLASWDL